MAKRIHRGYAMIRGYGETSKTRQDASPNASPTCTAAVRPSDWLYELKLDGFRALAHVQGGRCELISRNGSQLNGFQPLCDAIAEELGPVSAILDGEIVCLHQKDGPEFFRL